MRSFLASLWRWELGIGKYVLAMITAFFFLVFILGGCSAGGGRHARTLQDDVNTACTGAANLYLVAIKQYRDGGLDKEEFTNVTDGYGAVIQVCSAVLEDGKPPTTMDLVLISDFSAEARRQTRVEE